MACRSVCEHIHTDIFCMVLYNAWLRLACTLCCHANHKVPCEGVEYLWYVQEGWPESACGSLSGGVWSPPLSRNGQEGGHVGEVYRVDGTPTRQKFCQGHWTCTGDAPSGGVGQYANLSKCCAGPATRKQASASGWTHPAAETPLPDEFEASTPPPPSQAARSPLPTPKAHQGSDQNISPLVQRYMLP